MIKTAARKLIHTFMITRMLSILAVILMLGGLVSASAQDEARPVWQVTSFDITVNNPGAERALNARATVSVLNIGRGSGSSLTLRINSKAEIKSVSATGATASYRVTPETRGGAQRVTIALAAAVAPNGTVSATVDYRLPVEENSGVAALSPVGSQFLPLSLWYPSPNTSLAVSGADYAPFRLTVSGANAVSSGTEKSASGDSVFEQTLHALPFFVVGSWDRLDGSGSGKGISAFLPKGASTDERKQAESLIALTADARAFCVGWFGAAPEVPLRLVASKRGAGFDDAGTILLSDAAFQRRKIDSSTALSIGEAVAHLWIGGATPVRGEGHGVVREALARFIATQFIEKQFGADAADGERARQRLAYESIAKRDAPLALMTPLDATYFNSISNKGAMIWRLLDQVIGRDAFTAALRGLLLSGQSDQEGFNLARARAVFAERGGPSVKAVLDAELDHPTDMDLVAGLPHQENGQWVAALRNLGSNEVTVTVAATTDSGQVVTVLATIPAHDFGQAVFKTTARVVRVEVDPEKLYPQFDYENDIAPRQVEISGSLAEVTRLFGAQEFAKADALARNLIAAAPRMQEARILFARTLLAENKTDEAEREFRKLADDRLPTPGTIAWSAIGLGEIALRRGQAAEAARDLNEAVRADAEYGSTVAARAARIRAEATAPPAIDESAKAFISQLDTAIRNGRQAEIAALIVPGELIKFVRGAVGTQPESWQTNVLRSEQLDADHLALDVTLSTKQLGVEHSGTAVYILARVGGRLKLNAIEYFEVR
jgi:tetratricopeptide (TPR) repeat protein